MIQKPRLKTFLTVFPLSDSTWGLRGGEDELWQLKLRGEDALKVFCRLLPYLDGTRETDEILTRLESEGTERKAAEALLTHLERRALIEDTSEGLSRQEEAAFRDQIAYFSRFTAQGGVKYQRRLRKAQIGVIGDGPLAGSIARQLDRSGFGRIVRLLGEVTESTDSTEDHAFGVTGVSEVGHAKISFRAIDREVLWVEDGSAIPELFIFAQEAHQPQLLHAMDGFSKRMDRPWLLVRALSAQEGWVGPLFIPAETASYLSLEARLKGSMPNYEEHSVFTDYLLTEGRDSARCGALASFHEVLAGIAVSEAVKLISEISIPSLLGRFLTLNLNTWETAVHEVLRIPRIDSASASRPHPFPWKEVPYDDAPSRRA